MARRRQNSSELVSNAIGGIVIGVCSVAIVTILFLGAVQSFGGGVSVLFQ